jgi:phage terminase large subunit GpA-like protein
MPRLECEVAGHGHDFRSASIIYKIFYGHIDNEATGAWAELRDWMIDTKLVFTRRDGFKFQVQRTFVDSGDGMFMDAAIAFCGGWAKTYPSKGRSELKQDKLKLGTLDAPTRMDFVRYVEKDGVIQIIVNYYKSHIYRKLKNKPDAQTGDQPANSHVTPTDYPDWYFKGLTIETQRKDGTFHNTAGGRNEPLDLLVGNMCASDHFIDGCKIIEIERFKRLNPNLRLSAEQLRERFKRKVVLQLLENELKKQGW